MKRLLRTAVVFGGIVGMAAALQAQPPGRGMRTAMGYDKSKEVTVTGTVVSVDEQQMMGTGRMGMAAGGTHLMLNTGSETLDVHVGPTAWLTDHKYTFAKGDQITVTGARTEINGAAALIAREIDKGGTTMTLRDENGRPLWAGPRR